MTDISKSIWIDAPPEVVFGYFTDADKMARWCGRSAELDAVPGGLYRVDMGEWGVVEGCFRRVDAPNYLAVEITGPGGGDAPPSVWEIRIAAEAGGSRVDLRHTGLQPPADLFAARVMDHHLARLSVAAAGGAPGIDTICARTMTS